MKKTIKITIKGKIDHVALLSKAIRAACSTVIQDEISLYNIELCIFEAVVNAIKHTSHKKNENYINAIVTIDQSEIIFQVINSGKHKSFLIPKKELDFDPKDLTSLPESGMGLFLIHHIMNKVVLKRSKKRSILLMHKKLSPN